MNPAKRLSADRLAPVPKTITRAASFRVATGRNPKPGELGRDEIFAELADIILDIENGVGAQKWRYRRSGRQVPVDETLKRYGLMHLHLTRKHGGQLLWLLQYDDHVLLLEVSDHSTFGDIPPGSRLVSYHAKAIADAEREMAERKP